MFFTDQIRRDTALRQAFSFTVNLSRAYDTKVTTEATMKHFPTVRARAIRQPGGAAYILLQVRHRNFRTARGEAR
jgi:hypothetical protein